MRPRIGHIQFLNCLPLYHMLVKNGAVLDIDLFKDTPIALSTRLLAGDLDIGPMPSIEYARHADQVQLLPGLAVASHGPVMSVLLVSKVALAKLDHGTVALSNTSRTSQVLTKILLQHYHGLDVRFFSCPPDLPEMLREADAALLIGDHALRAYAATDTVYYKYDLGAMWREHSAHPMVYAVWAARNDYVAHHPERVQAVTDMFAQSKRMSIQEVDAIAADIARWEPFPAAFLRDYFQALKFDFDAPFQTGLRTYYQQAVDIGELAAIPPLRFAPVTPGAGA